MAVRHPPTTLVAAYTLNHTVPLLNFFIDESALLPVRYQREELCVSPPPTHHLQRGHKPRGVSYAAVTEALSHGGAVPVDQAAVVVFGATDPWVECLSVSLGAKSVMTVEYLGVEYEHAKLSSMRVSAFEAAVMRPDGPRFDVAIALSAFDHDGLGRYGDRLQPDGDMLAMRLAWRSLRPGGHLLLSAPVGPDLIVWNMHRRYGPIRLPRLLTGWEEVARLDWEQERLTAAADHRRRYEPLFILRRNSTSTADTADLEIQSSIDAAAVEEACAATESGE